ncbi:MAG: FAD-dependent oxidoreductase [Alphaproteobacteria bacterium]|nr:FAD-dependent oxidoreductase [Alphaproteobacteria bacterium]MBV9694711.1 FAD-dependent oxidoreductase [Alphaproteobacteria bacterium]
MSAPADAIVIGAGIGGIAAAACLERKGVHVVLLEAAEAGSGVREFWPVLEALDPALVKTLKLSRRGFKFIQRDLPTLALRQDGRHLLLPRDPHKAARAIVACSPADARAYERRQAEIFALARRLRPWWWETAEAPAGLPERYKAASAQALLAALFESDAVRTTLGFDVPEPFAPGSALALLWRAGQEMCGLQGARALPQGGVPALADAMMASIRELGVSFRSKARVRQVLVAGDEAAGVVLDSGEKIFSRAVVSCLSRRDTLLRLLPTASAGIAQTLRLLSSAPRRSETVAVLTLNGEPGLGGRSSGGAVRHVIAEGEPALEGVASDAPSPGQHRFIVKAKGTPTADAIVAQLERFAPQFRSRVLDIALTTRTLCPPKLLASAQERIATPIRNLFLCGRDAEPVDALSGRAGRLAAEMVSAALQRKARP